MWVADAGSPTGPAQAGKQVWIVKVVRREAVVSVVLAALQLDSDATCRLAPIPFCSRRYTVSLRRHKLNNPRAILLFRTLVPIHTLPPQTSVLSVLLHQEMSSFCHVDIW